MKKVKEVGAKCLYVFQGRSCAKEELVRNLDAAKEFITSAHERFGGYMKIRDYCISQDTWTLLVELEDDETIRSTYLRARKKSRTAKTEHTHTEIWKITSECIRHWLSRFVKRTNFQDGREGTLRLKTYEKYFFESYSEAKEYIQKMKDQLIRCPQKVKGFRVERKRWNLRKLGIGHVYLCSKGLNEEEMSRVFGVGSIAIVGLLDNVLRTLVKITISSHKHEINQKAIPKIE